MSQENQNTVNQLDGERGIPSVNETQSSNTKKRAFAFLGILLIIAIALFAIYWKLGNKQADVSAKQKELTLSSSVPARTFVAPPSPPPLPKAAEPKEPDTSAATDAPPPLPNSRMASGASNAGSPALPGDVKSAAVLDKSFSDLMVEVQSQRQGASHENAELGGNNQGNLGGGNSNGPMAELLSSTKTAQGKAGFIGNRNLLLAKGAFINCGLITSLNSTVPGMSSCRVSRNVYSDNGKVLLIERGSIITGEYQSNMRQGMARIFVLWNRIKTPNGVVVDLDSPGADPLGGSGIPGYVDTHFWQRFGGALMLSLVDDVARGITTSSSNNSQFNFSSTGDATQNMAAEALRNTINIPPTLSKNQGEEIGIYVARDLDFSGVYDVSID